MQALDDLIKQLSRLPGIGGKSAGRIAYYLISSDEAFNNRLGESISTLKSKIGRCPVCGAFTEGDVCEYCSDERRDKSLMCVVEQPQDVITISQAGVYNGLFHVLGGAINPLEGIGAEALTFRELLRRCEEGEVRELIIATNPTEEGDTTALYVKHLLKNHPEIALTRLASGLPIGGDLEYADRLTLARSLRGRISFS